MSRTALRLVGVTTALLVAGAVAPAAVSPAAAEPPVAEPAARAASGITIGDSAVSSATFSTTRPAAASARARWPIGGGSADLTAHPAAPTGDASQQFTRVRMAHYRAFRGVMEAVVDLGATPTTTTNSVVLLAFGRVSADGSTCDSAAGHNISFTSTDTDTRKNPVYRGSRITVRPFSFPAARRATWNCAFAQTLDPSDTTVKYDAVAGGAGLFRQTPALSIQVKGRKLKRQGYTRVPIVVRNSAGTVATAPDVRLSWRTKGVTVRANRKVGAIRPGTAKRSVFFVKDTRRGTGRITFTVRSRDYQRRLTVAVRETRR